MKWKKIVDQISEKPQKTAKNYINLNGIQFEVIIFDIQL